MAQELRQGTAVDVLIGPFVDETNGKDAETGLTILQADVRLSKNGQNIAQKNDANAAAHDELGYHNCPLNGTDTDTLGLLDLAVHEAGALPVHHTFMVVTQNFWDAKYSTDELHVDVVQWLGQACAAVTVNGVPEVDMTHLGGVAQSATDLKDFADTGYNPGTHSVDLVDTTTTNSDMVAEAPDAAAVETACDASLTSYDGPTDGELDTAIGLVTAVVGGLADAAAVGEVTEADTLMQYMKQLLNVLIGATGIGAWPAEQAPANGINLFEAIRAIHADTDVIPTVAAIADAIWDEARAGHSGSGTYGESFFGMVAFACEAGTLSTTEATTDLAEATNDHYIGRTIIWLDGDLALQATDVTDYVGVNGHLTFSLCTEAPGDGDRGILV